MLDADPYIPPSKGSGGCMLSSLGHVIQEDDEFIYLSRDSGEYGEGREGCEIPKVNVIEVRVLGAMRKRKLPK